MFEEIEEETFAVRESRILRFWKDQAIFMQSLKNREGAKYFSFYDGPPFATGLPHYGHLLAGTIKDVVPRYKTMKGYYVPRRFGWDCHGLPIENEIEKAFELSGAPSIEAFGIGKFNEECRAIVQRYAEEWKSSVEKMGRWVDFSKVWKTMDVSYMETVWWAFKEIYEKGLVYEGYKVMPFSAKLGTPLSNFEAGENYKDVDDPSLVVCLPLKEEPDTSLLVWTTTPWTLISNMAATIGAEIDYLKLEHSGKKYILAEATVPLWFKKKEEVNILTRFKGAELVGKHYVPPFAHFAHLEEEGAFRVIADDFVTLEEGTGIVHTAPAFGEADFYAAKKAGIPLVSPVDNNGHFTSDVPEFQGQFVKDADKAIAKDLKSRGLLLYQGTIHHRYPFCWRSDTPLIYKAITTWFVHVEKIKDKLLHANSQIHWMPEHLKVGRFGKWLEGARDWAISRNRYWGTPIPIWRSTDGDIKVIGSIKELEELTGKTIPDIHRHLIDDLTFTIDGKVYKRIPEVFDCWFDTGCMPYAQNHYPFENKEFTEKTFPADFVAEGIDQTRGWFYTLTIIAAALYDKPAFKNVVVNGIILAEDGNKMSKRLRNYPDPLIVIGKYGADAVRLYMLNSPAVKADDLRFSEKGVELVLRQVLIPFWNAHAFLLTYSRINQWKPEGDRRHPEAKIDRWILSELNRLISEVESGMDVYDLSRAVEPLVGFVDKLTNWYIRRNRRRFWSDVESQDRREAFETLYHVMMQLTKVAAPFVPFISEAVYLNLKVAGMPESVHCTDFPVYSGQERDLKLEEGMSLLQVAVSSGHALRKEHKLKVRQPLSAVHIVCLDPVVRSFLSQEQQLILDELNVKKLVLHDKKQEFVKLSIKPNFRVLGKKLGSHLKEAQNTIQSLSQEQIQTIQEGDSLPVTFGGVSFILSGEDMEITHTVSEGWAAMSAGPVTIALETELTDELILEGFAREIINKINTMRRDAGFAVTDRIVVHLQTTDRVKQALKIYESLIKEEVLALEMRDDANAASIEIDLNGEPAKLSIEKVPNV